jgi:hypothetical protein
MRNDGHPDAEEIRMVRAIARLALLEAIIRGKYHASFHGFVLDAVRCIADSGAGDVLEVRLAVRMGNSLAECCTISLPAYACSVDKISFLSVQELTSCPTLSEIGGLRAPCALWLAHCGAIEVSRWLSQPARCTSRTTLRSQEHPNRPHLLKAGGPKPGDLCESLYPNRGAHSPVRGRSPQRPSERRS